MDSNFYTPLRYELSTKNLDKVSSIPGSIRDGQ